MIKKEKILIRTFLTVLLLSLPLAIAENVIYGDALPEIERLVSLDVSSDPFSWNNISYIYVKAYNSNNTKIELNSLTIEPYNLTNYDDYKATVISYMLNQQYKRGFTIENESIDEITFKITAIKGDKVITQDYIVKLYEPEKTGQFKEKSIASLNFLRDMVVNNWITIIIVALVFFFMIFIIKGVGYLMK